VEADQKTHVIEHRAVWFDRSVVQWVADWVDKEQGLVWTPYPLFGTEVAALAGVPFFHSLGIPKAYGSIETYSAKTGAVVSIQSNLVGRNLQDRWSKALIVAPPSKSDDLNQIIGRLHRTGQRAECVEVKFLFTCAQHLQAVQKSRARAEFDRSLLSARKFKAAERFRTADFFSIPEFRFWRLVETLPGIY
jgi:hypothetical protein